MRLFVCRGWGRAGAEARWLGFPRPGSDDPLLGAAGDVSSKERIKEEEALGLVLCANLLCCPPLSGPQFHFL